MKKIKIVLLIGLVCTMVPFNAQEKTQTDWEKVAELGGVQRVKKDKNGVIQSFVVGGKARISNVLGPVKGVAVAREKATLQAKAEIVKWMKEKVTVKQRNKENSIILVEGKDGKLTSEQGKSVDEMVMEIETYASGITKALTPICTMTKTYQNENYYIIVFGWSAANTISAQQAEAMMNAPLQNNAKKQDTPQMSKHPEKTTVSDEANQY